MISSTNISINARSSIRIAGTKVIYFVTGDTDANEDNVKVECDVLFVPCGGKYTFDIDEADGEY